MDDVNGLEGGVEEILEPERRICDAHHHLWDHQSRYLLEDFLADTASGHDIVSTVFVECASMYRAEGPPEFRFVGETEFVQGVAAMSASGAYGDTRVASAIVSRVRTAVKGSSKRLVKGCTSPSEPLNTSMEYASGSASAEGA